MPICCPGRSISALSRPSRRSPSPLRGARIPPPRGSFSTRSATFCDPLRRSRFGASRPLGAPSFVPVPSPADRLRLIAVRSSGGFAVLSPISRPLGAVLEVGLFPYGLLVAAQWARVFRSSSVSSNSSSRPVGAASLRTVYRCGRSLPARWARVVVSCIVFSCSSARPVGAAWFSERNRCGEPLRARWARRLFLVDRARPASPGSAASDRPSVGPCRSVHPLRPVGAVLRFASLHRVGLFVTASRRAALRGFSRFCVGATLVAPVGAVSPPASVDASSLARVHRARRLCSKLVGSVSRRPAHRAGVLLSAELVFDVAPRPLGAVLLCRFGGSRFRALTARGSCAVARSASGLRMPCAFASSSTWSRAHRARYPHVDGGPARPASSAVSSRLPFIRSLARARRAPSCLKIRSVSPALLSEVSGLPLTAPTRRRSPVDLPCGSCDGAPRPPRPPARGSFRALARLGRPLPAAPTGALALVVSIVSIVAPLQPCFLRRWWSRAARRLVIHRAVPAGASVLLVYFMEVSPCPDNARFA